MTQAFPDIAVCTDCRHPEGSHVMENKVCAVGGCGCKQYLPGGATPTTPTPPPVDSAAPAPAAAPYSPPLKDEHFRKRVDKLRARLPLSKLGLSKQLQQMALAMVQQVLAGEVMAFLREQPGRRVVLTSNEDGVELEAFNADGTPFDDFMEQATDGK